MTKEDIMNGIDEATFSDCPPEKVADIKVKLINLVYKDSKRKPIIACPNCQKSLLSIGQPYCNWCGQALDWSDINE